jgi:hypothetical protein
MSETKPVTVIELLQAADAAYQKNVPVDWRSLCFNIFQTLSQRINELDQEIRDLEYSELDKTQAEEEPDEVH